jgi:hypothetical protein
MSMDYTAFERLTVSEIVKSVEVSAYTGELFRVEIADHSTKDKKSFKARYFEQKLNYPNTDGDMGGNLGFAIWVEADRPWVDKQTANEALLDALDFLENSVSR